MNMKSLAFVAFFLNTVLFATYYAVSKEVLGRIDPILFTYLEMMTLVPAALCILLFSWQKLSQALVKQGIILGSALCLALFTISIALKYSSATGTAFFPSLNGFLAALIALVFLRQPISKTTWCAGLLSAIGTLLLILNAPMGGIRGSLIAFLGGLFFTGYVFLSDTGPHTQQEQWPLFGIELLTMAVWANLVVLLFGDWQDIHLALPKDGWIILYVAGACTFLPTMLAVLMQKHISPVTVSFVYILEPVLGAVVANLYLREMLPLEAYIGGGLVVAGAFIHTWGSAGYTATHRKYEEYVQYTRGYRGQRSQIADGEYISRLIGPLSYPIILFSTGMYLLYTFGEFPPPSWSTVYTYGFQAIAPAHLLLLAQAICWLVVWISLLSIGVLTCIRSFYIIRRYVTQPEMMLMQQQRHIIPTHSHVYEQRITRAELMRVGQERVS